MACINTFKSSKVQVRLSHSFFFFSESLPDPRFASSLLFSGSE